MQLIAANSDLFLARSWLRRTTTENRWVNAGLERRATGCRGKELTDRMREADGRSISLFVHRSDAEEIIVFRHALHGITLPVANRARVCPDRRSSVTPNDFVARDIGFLVCVPLEISVVGEPGSYESNIFWTSRSERERGE